MDITYRVENEKFNYRVCAMIINDDKILAMHDERSPYYYLPGGSILDNQVSKRDFVGTIVYEDKWQVAVWVENGEMV